MGTASRKTISTILISITILSSIMVSVSATEYLQSLSAYALSDNALWYRLMHLTAVMFFMLNTDKNKYNLFIGFLMALILAFDMYHYETIHNVVTASALALAGFSLISVAKGFTRIQMIFITACAVGVFCLGYFNNTVHHLLAEIIAMTCIMNGKLIELWKINQHQNSTGFTS